MHIPHRGMKQGGLSASGKGYCDEASIYDLVQRNPTIGRRILNWIDSVLAGLGGKNAREHQFLRRARSLYVSALRETDGLDQASRFGMARNRLQDDLTAGRLTEREYDEAMDALSDTESMEGEGLLEQFSISETDDGRAVAVVDSNILSRIDTTVWDKTKKAQAKKAAKTALLSFKNGVRVNGITYKVNKVSRDEFTRSNDTERLYRKEPEIFADKLRASANADDIITATTSWANDGKLTHPRTDNFVDFAHGKVLIQAETNQYEAETVVGITDAGEYVFYDVVDMEPTSFKVKEELSTAATDKDAKSAIQESSSEDSITKNGLPVKEQFSNDRRGNDSNQIANDLRQMLNRGASTEELRRYVDGISGNRQQTTMGRNVMPAERIVRAAHRQGLSVQEYLQQNRELYDVDGVKQRFGIKLRGSHWLPRNFAYDIVCTLMWG